MKKPLYERSLKELHRLFPIHLTEHQEQWDTWYQEEAEALQEALAGKPIIRISHIGSTAIKGIWAKPIIDILVEIPEEGNNKKCVKRVFQPLRGIARPDNLT